MKHLRKFNESIKEDFFFSSQPVEIDIDYIKSVFVDFIEDGARVILSTNSPVTNEFPDFSPSVGDKVESHNIKTCEVIIKIPELSGSERYSSKIEAFIKKSDDWTNTLKDIQSCIGRILDEFPTIRYKVSYSSFDKIIITFTIDKNLYLG